MPTGLWNETVSLLGSTLKEAAGAFNAAFKHGAEPHLQDLVQTFIPQLVYALGRQLMEAVLNQERGFYGSRIRCPDCGQVLEFEGYIERGVKTKLGPIRFKRAYYHGACGHTAFPIDSLLRIDGKHGVLPDLQECAALLATTTSYPQALELLQRLLPVGTFSLHLQEEITRSVASDFIALQRDEAEAAKPGWRDGEELQDKTVVASVDGGMCRVRDHADRYREFKLAVMGDLGSNLEVTNKTYVATFEGPDALFHKAIFEYVRKRHDRAQRVHLVADGASWIERRADELTQPGQELSMVLDWYHTTERLKAFANEALGAGTGAGTAWYEAGKSALYEGELDTFFKMLRDSVKASIPCDGGKPKEELESTLKYFEKRRKLLCYKWCRDNGLPIGSGMVEGGIRFVGKDRLDCTGMRWGTPGAADVLQLRCINASERWDEFRAMRSKKGAERFASLKAAWLQAA
ncbi:MAG: ISKra4 family transposase [Thermoanaerobaculia bacterium]|nr:ISKra4 family transposase [Thermoanaerobaculia bacterium]